MHSDHRCLLFVAWETQMMPNKCIHLLLELLQDRCNNVQPSNMENVHTMTQHSKDKLQCLYSAIVQSNPGRQPELYARLILAVHSNSSVVVAWQNESIFKLRSIHRVVRPHSLQQRSGGVCVYRLTNRVAP